MAQEVRIDLEFVAKGLQGVESQVAKLNNSLVKANKIRFKGLKNAFSSIGKGIVVANQGLELLGKTVRVATGFFGKFVNEARKIEDLTTQFQVLTGSVTTATRLIQDLQEFSARTPFQVEGIANASRQLLAFGFSVDDILPKLQELGDVAAGSGSSLEEVALIYGQVAAAGKLTGERLLQFQERAIPIGPAIAKTMGVAEAAVRDLVSQGKVTQDVFEDAFALLSAEGGLFADGMIKQSKTLSGVISTLQDNINLLLADIGKFLLPLFKQAASAMITFIQANKELIKVNAAKAIGFLIKSFGTLLKAAKPIAILFNAIKDSTEAIANVLLSAARAIVKFAVIMNDLSKVFGENKGRTEALERVYADLDGAVRNSDRTLTENYNNAVQFGDEADKLAKKVMNLGEEFSKAANKKPIKLKAELDVKAPKKGIQGIPTAAEEKLSIIAGAISGGKPQQILTTFLNKSQSIWAKAIAAIIEIFAVNEDKFRERAKATLSLAANIGQQVVTNIGVLFEELANNLPEAITNAVTAVPSSIETFLESFEDIIANEELWERVGESMANSFADPEFLNRIIKIITVGFTRGLIASIPRFVDGVVSGIRSQLDTVFDKFGGAVDVFKTAINQIKSGGISGAISGGGGILQGVGDFLGFANGGEVPNLSQFRNDGGVAKVSAGENIIDKSTNDQLKDFLNNQGSQQMVINLQVGEQDLANVLLNLNQKGFRVA